MTTTQMLSSTNLNDADIGSRASGELLRVTAFLDEIGLPWRWQENAHGFIEHVDIVDGELRIDPRAPASGVLHEAGHLALLPAEFRRRANSDLSQVLNEMMEETDFSDPDAPAARAAMQCSDPEATAWAWAAGVYLGLPAQRIIQDHEYDGEGGFIRLRLQVRQYLGINGLASAGWCAVRPGPWAERRQLPAFPELARWLQVSFAPQRNLAPGR